MDVFRIHGQAYDPFDTMGTVLFAGRWHTRGTRILYTAQHISLAALEALIHAGGRKFPPKMLTRITLPDKLPIEQASAAILTASPPLAQRASQDLSTFAATQAFGDRWILENRSAILRVPSVATNNLEFNYLLNPAHPDFHRIAHTPPLPFPFDPRLFNPLSLPVGYSKLTQAA